MAFGNATSIEKICHTHKTLKHRNVNLLAQMGIDAWVARVPSTPAPCVEARVMPAEMGAHVPEHIENKTPTPPASVEPTAQQRARDLDSLRSQVAHCEKCPLHEGRAHTVFGAGAVDAEWMLVGEAPGQEEDDSGQPFAGPAGQLLTAMLRAAGFDREQVYITNVVKCRPPRNRNPNSREIDACADYLTRQIELVQPKVVVALGKVAANHLLQTETALSRLRGRVHAIAPSNNALVATYHPAYLLRKPVDKAKAWQDLKLALQVSR